MGNDLLSAVSAREAIIALAVLGALMAMMGNSWRARGPTHAEGGQDRRARGLRADLGQPGAVPHGRFWRHLKDAAYSRRSLGKPR